METALHHHVIELEDCGPVSVYIQGDEKKLKEGTHGQGTVFLTVHDVGSTYQAWVDFANTCDMENVKGRSVFLHVAVPGQEPGASAMPKEFTFPTMAQFGLGLVTILDQLRVPGVVALGDGAGANVLTRFAMAHPTRVHGIVAVNNTATVSMGMLMDRLKLKMNALQKDQGGLLNEKNVAKFAESYNKRKEILSELNKRMKTDVLLLAGALSKYVGDTETIHREMAPGLCSMIKIDNVSDLMSEAPHKVAEAVLLFCQGLGLLPSVARRMSGCQDDRSSLGQGNRKISVTMAELDKPITRVWDDLDMPAATLSF